MRVRSSVTRWRARSSCSRSARSARSARCSMRSRRRRMLSPMVNAAMSTTPIPRTSVTSSGASISAPRTISAMMAPTTIDRSVATAAGAVRGHRVHGDHHADPAGSERLRHLARELRREHDEEDRDREIAGATQSVASLPPPARSATRTATLPVRSPRCRTRARSPRAVVTRSREQPVTGIGVSAQPADRVEP